MDGLFLRMIFQRINGRGDFIFNYKKSCLRHTVESLNYGGRPEWSDAGFHSRRSSMTAAAGNEEECAGGMDDGKGETGESKRVNRGVATRIVMHLSTDQTSVPSHDELAYYISNELFGGQILPRRFVVTHLRTVKPGTWTTAISPAETSHPDLALPQDSDENRSSVLTLRKLGSDMWLSKFVLQKIGWAWLFSLISDRGTLKCRLEPSSVVVEVSLLVCNTGKTLRERRWLCDMLEREADELERQHDASAAAHVRRRLDNFRKTLPTINDELIELMIDRLESNLLKEVLQASAGGHLPSTGFMKQSSEWMLGAFRGDTLQAEGAAPGISGNADARPMTIEQLQITLGATFSVGRFAVCAFVCQ